MCPNAESSCSPSLGPLSRWPGADWDRLATSPEVYGSKGKSQIHSICDFDSLGSVRTHGTAARRVMSFAPGKGASETTFMLPRVPVVPRYSLARMSSMARSNFRIA
jgi:hypothetical protein